MPDPTKADSLFPDRPTHPDFVRISLVMQTLDMESEQPDFDYRAYTEQVVDLPSFFYAGNHRAGTGIDALGMVMEKIPPMLRAFIVSTWMDGFMIGAQFQKQGGHQ